MDIQPTRWASALAATGTPLCCISPRVLATPAGVDVSYLLTFNEPGR